MIVADMITMTVEEGVQIIMVESNGNKLLKQMQVAQSNPVIMDSVLPSCICL